MCCENFYLSSGVLGVGLDADFSCRGVPDSRSVRNSPHSHTVLPNPQSYLDIARYFEYRDMAAEGIIVFTG
jgi:hypothetical protein